MPTLEVDRIKFLSAARKQTVYVRRQLFISFKQELVTNYSLWLKLRVVDKYIFKTIKQEYELIGEQRKVR